MTTPVLVDSTPSAASSPCGVAVEQLFAVLALVPDGRAQNEGYALLVQVAQQATPCARWCAEHGHRFNKVTPAIVATSAILTDETPVAKAS